jgi:hypothetical protein
MRNTSVSLGEHFTRFIDAQVQAGRYGSVSDVVLTISLLCCALFLLYTMGKAA